MTPASVLLIDDSPDEAGLLSEAKAETASLFHHTAECDGSAAFDRLMSTSSIAWPDLVLLDLNMPSITGMQFLTMRRLDDRLLRLPVFMHTSSRKPADIAAAFALGADSFLFKSVDWSDTLRLTRDLDRFLHHGEPMPLDESREAFRRSGRQTAAWERWIGHRRLMDGSRHLIERLVDALKRRSSPG